jgi:DNA-binding MarR family transcriptional regulator
VARPELSVEDYRRLAAVRFELRRFLRVSEEAARAAGLTPAQHQLLLAIRGWEGDADPSTSEIAQRLQQKLHSTSGLLARAEEAGLVSRRPDRRDARRQLVRLTASGRRRLRTLYTAHRDELERARKSLGDALAATVDGA